MTEVSIGLPPQHATAATAAALRAGSPSPRAPGAPFVRDRFRPCPSLRRIGGNPVNNHRETTVVFPAGEAQ